jgi:hypothetical protein
MDDIKGILTDDGKGFRLAYAREQEIGIDEATHVIDVALAMAKAWHEGLDVVASVVSTSQRDMDDPYLWAAIGFLSSRLPEGDLDAMAWTGLVRNKSGVGSAVRQIATSLAHAEAQNSQRSLFDVLEMDSEGTVE